MLSPYCKQILEKYNVSIGQVSKLVPTLANKEKYVLHYRDLQLYLDLGLKLKTTHRALEFNQSPWLAQYIDYNTKNRMPSKNAFEKDFFQLMKNSVFGKTVENLRKRCDVRLVTDRMKFLKMVFKPTDVGKKEFTEDLVTVHNIKETLVFNRPAYVGMCILDLSKTLTYDFHYNYMKKKYGSIVNLGFTDADSLCCEITTKDAYAVFGQMNISLTTVIIERRVHFLIQQIRKSSGNSRMRPLGYPSRNLLGSKARCIVTLKTMAKMKRPAKGLRKMS